MKKTINNSLIKKPWGYEMLFYRNENLAIWFLDINHKHKTSLHSHLEKNTGLIVLDGIAKVSFLNNSINLKGLEKVQIFSRRFHSTEALTNYGVKLLEVESPENKTDLVRFIDDYGREEKPYETEENYQELTDKHIKIPDNAIDWSGKVEKCFIKVFPMTNKDYFNNRDFEEIIIFLNGGLMTKDNKLIVRSGDVCSCHNVEVLVKKFDFHPDTVIMSISK